MNDALQLSDVTPEYWVHLAGMLLVVAAGLVLQARLRAPWRPLVRLAVLLLSVRLLLVGNPFAWDLYARKLRPTEVGWRQYDAIRLKRSEFLSPGRHLRYLAVGSSQTGAIYDGLTRDRTDVGLLTVAAMLPLDFVLYRDDIDRLRPPRILLYLSDFDVAKRPSSEAMVIAPHQGWRLLGLWWRMRGLPEGDHYTHAMTEMLVGELFPEYKYRFVFRALADKAVQRAARHIGVRDPGPRPPRDTQEQMIEWARESMSAAYIPLNLAFLRDYLDHATARGSDVVIVEGHYNPLVFTPATEASSRRVHEALQALADTMEGVTFVPRSTVLEFRRSDYYDLSHVNPRAGYAFADRVIGLLDRDDPRDSRVPSKTSLRQ